MLLFVLGCIHNLNRMSKKSFIMHIWTEIKKIQNVIYSPVSSDTASTCSISGQTDNLAIKVYGNVWFI